MRSTLNDYNPGSTSLALQIDASGRSISLDLVPGESFPRVPLCHGLVQN